MSDRYFKEFCPKCKTKNWFVEDSYAGDCSKMDSSIVLECFKCNQRFIPDNDYLTVDEMCEAQDHMLLHDLEGNIEEFMKQSETTLGMEKIE